MNSPTSFLPAAKAIVRDKGVKALWAGFPAKAAHLGLGGAMMAGLQPVFTRACGRAWREVKGGATEE